MGSGNFFDESGKILSEGDALPENSDGVTREYFTEPELYSDYVDEPQGIIRTNLVGNPSIAPLEPGLPVDPESSDRFQQQGFTPPSYYRAPSGEFIIKTNPDKIGSSKKKLDDYIKAIANNTTKPNFPDTPSYESPGNQGDLDFKFGLKSVLPLSERSNFKNERETFDGSYNVNSWEKNVKPYNLYDYKGTPFDNEDPIYHGFEVILDVLNSPLLNGDVDKFIDSYGGNYTDISSLKEIVQTLKSQLRKYFKMTGLFQSPVQNIFGLAQSPNENVDNSNFRDHIENKKDVYGHKHHYVKKISGLDKLVEANEPNKSNSFVKYGEDLITLTFYEDITMNTGGLFSLYKNLYWSRLRGKGLIPENLLRFDCYIIVSEVRNMRRIKTYGTGENISLQFLTDNLSRYVYRLYECQFHIPKMTHGDAIDMYGIAQFDSQDITMSYKYSTMKYERFIPDAEYANSDKGSLVSVSLDNKYPNPRQVNSSSTDRVNTTATQSSVDGSAIAPEPPRVEMSVLGYENATTNLSEQDILTEGDINPATGAEAAISAQEQVSSGSTDVLGQIKNNAQKSSFEKVQNQELPYLQVIKDKNLFQSANKDFIEDIKAKSQDAIKSANNREALLDKTLSNIRDSFNVNVPQNLTSMAKKGNISSNNFFDVKNALGNFPDAENTARDLISSAKKGNISSNNFFDVKNALGNFPDAENTARDLISSATKGNSLSTNFFDVKNALGNFPDVENTAKDLVSSARKGNIGSNNFFDVRDSLNNLAQNNIANRVPTNLSSIPNSSSFFDVQNSLRNFGGEGLSDFFGGINFSR